MGDTPACKKQLLGALKCVWQNSFLTSVNTFLISLWAHLLVSTHNKWNFGLVLSICAPISDQQSMPYHVTDNHLLWAPVNHIHLFTPHIWFQNTKMMFFGERVTFFCKGRLKQTFIPDGICLLTQLSGHLKPELYHEMAVALILSAPLLLNKKCRCSPSLLLIYFINNRNPSPSSSALPCYCTGLHVCSNT